MRQQFKVQLLDYAWVRTKAYRCFNFLRIVTPIAQRVQLRTLLRFALVERWSHGIKAMKARVVMRKVIQRIDARRLMHWWRYAAEQRRLQAMHQYAITSVSEGRRLRMLSDSWQQWFSLASKARRLRQLGNMEQELVAFHRMQRLQRRFDEWRVAVQRAQQDRERAAEEQARTARRVQHLLSLQLAHVCNKFALLRRMFKLWRVRRVESAERRRKERQVQVPVLPLFMGEDGTVVVHSPATHVSNEQRARQLAVASPHATLPRSTDQQWRLVESPAAARKMVEVSSPIPVDHAQPSFGAIYQPLFCHLHRRLPLPLVNPYSCFLIASTPSSFSSSPWLSCATRTHTGATTSMEGAAGTTTQFTE